MIRTVIPFSRPNSIDQNAFRVTPLRLLSRILTPAATVSDNMPKRDAKDGGHTAFTDHRIQRQPVPEQTVTEDTDISAWREPVDDNLRKRNLGSPMFS